MKYRIFIAVIAAAITSACSTGQSGAQGQQSEKVTLMQRHEDLIRLYHQQADAPPMDQARVLNALAGTFNDKFTEDAKDFVRERDVFRRKERGDALFREYSEFAKKSSVSEVVAVITTVYIKPYDLEKKRFVVCVDSYSGDCWRYKSNGVKVNQGIYKMQVDIGEHGDYNFSPSDADARRIESTMSRLSDRIVTAVVFARTSGISPCIDSNTTCTVYAKPFRIELKEPANSKRNDWETNQYRYPTLFTLNI
jgi:hypothetical protein